MNLIEFLDDFKKNNSMLWVENNNISVFVSDKFINPKLKKTLKDNKSEIIDFLKYNKVFSKKDFQNKTIFKYDIEHGLLSFSQSRLWFIEQYKNGTNAYHIPFLSKLIPTVSLRAIEYAFNKIIERHEVLRSIIVNRNSNEIGLKVLSEKVVLKTKDFTNYQSLISYVRKSIDTPFKLASEYPIRAKLLNNADSSRFLFINIHHIAFDGWSASIFWKEFSYYYNLFIDNDFDSDLLELELQYNDYAFWQKKTLSDAVLSDQLLYWKSQLNDCDSLNLPTDFIRPTTLTYQGDNLKFNLTKGLSIYYRDLAKELRVSLHSLMLSTFKVLLSKLCGQSFC